jgi:hypothetical protein
MTDNSYKTPINSQTSQIRFTAQIFQKSEMLNALKEQQNPKYEQGF